MASIVTNLTCELTAPVSVFFLPGNMFSMDNGGNIINVFVVQNGEPVALGGSVSANVIRSDGTTVAITGALEGNKAYIILPQACYAVPGIIHIVMKITEGTTITTIAAITANVYQSSTDAVVDPGQLIPSIAALIEAIEEAVDSIPVDYSGLLATLAADYSTSKTYKVGDYAWYGGVLKRCISPITTAESYTAAHWANAVIGDDLSALKGALKSAFARTITFTNNAYIKYADGTTGGNYAATKASDYIDISNVKRINLSGFYDGSIAIANAIGCAIYDANKAYIDGIHYTTDNTISFETLPTNARYFRFTVYVGVIDSYTLNFITDQSKFVSMDATYNSLEQIEICNIIGAYGKNKSETVEMTSGKYVNSSGSVVNIDYASVSDYISTKNATYVYAYLTSALCIAFYDSSKAMIQDAYINDTTNTHTAGSPKLYDISTLAANAAFMRISNDDTHLLKADIRIVRTDEESQALGMMYEYQPTTISGKYVSTVQNGQESSVDYAEVTGFIPVYGILAVKTSLGSVLSLCYYNENKEYINGITGTTGESPAYRTLDIPNNAVYLKISNDTRYNTNGIFIKNYIPKEVSEGIAKTLSNTDRINNINNNYYKKSFDTVLSMFSHITCIGDSLTWSQVYTADDEQRRAYKPYPVVLGSLTGVETSSNATPGDSAILWWQRSSANAFDNHGLYIVFLGTNGGLTNTIDTDCIGTNPDTFAATNTGQYGRILQTIANNGDTAVLIKPWAGGGGTAESLNTTRAVIDLFATKYNFCVIDVTSSDRSNLAFHYFPDGESYNSLHFNDLGYSWFANEIRYLINQLSYDDQFKIMRRRE